MNREISVHSDEIKVLGAIILEKIFDELPDPISVQNMLLTIETLKFLTHSLTKKLEDQGVKISYRREEKA